MIRRSFFATALAALLPAGLSVPFGKLRRTRRPPPTDSVDLIRFRLHEALGDMPPGVSWAELLETGNVDLVHGYPEFCPLTPGRTGIAYMDDGIWRICAMET